MKIRWKILAILLSISMVPMLAMRWNASGIFHALAEDLAQQARSALIRQSTTALKRLVEDHARVLKREGELVEMVLRVQSSELEKRLSGAAPPKETHLPDRAWRTGELPDRKPPAYCRLTGKGVCKPFTVSHLEARWIVPPDAHRDSTEGTMARLSGMAATYDAVDREFPNIFLWQMVVLENGMQSVYPAPADIPVYDGRHTDWYRKAREMDGVMWSMPAIDPLTRQIVIPVTAPIRGEDGRFLGVAATMVPVSTLLHENQHIRMISQNVTSLLVRAEPKPGGGGASRQETGIQILASEQLHPSHRERWQYLQKTQWLEADAPDALSPVVSDLTMRRSGTSEVTYRGRATLMAYSVISAEGTSLLLIVPKSDLIADAEHMERYVQDRFLEEMRITGTIFTSVLFGVFLLSLFLSRNLTKNIRKLVDGARRLATGDFSTRIDIRSRDEMGELGRAFNRMVPDLEDRIRLKQGIEVASSVQKGLLPKHPPDVPGLDIAAASLFCDETGGDFYDFIALRRGGRTGIGIAVGDVSGHGISAALLMATARAFLRGRVDRPGSLAEKIGDVNRLVSRDTDDTGQFLTLYYMELMAGAGAIEWVRAGHDPGLLYDPETDAFRELKGPGTALGVDGDATFAASRRQGLRAGQIIAVGTDGIWECRNEAGEMFGRDRFRSVIRAHAGGGAREVLDGVVSGLNAFRGGKGLEDDVTLVVVKATGEVP